jgi:hypothetical protein
VSERDLDDLLYGLLDATNPPDALGAAEARVLDRLDRTMESRPRALHAAFRSARRTVLALVAVGGVATGAAATAAIAIAMPSATEGRIEIVADPANPERIAFTAVKQSTQEPDQRKRALFRALARDAPGVRPDDARGVRASDGTQAWVIPGPTRTCFGADNADGTGYTCTSNASVLRGGLSSAAVDTEGTVRAIYLVPDDVASATAGGQTVAPRNNLVVMTYPSGSTVTFTTKSGDVTSRRD